MAAKFSALLKDRKPLLGTLLSLPSPEIAEIAVAAGFDWLFLDMEHGLLDALSLQRLVQAVAGRLPCLVRVPANDAVWIGRALDTGADGLIFPHVNSAAEALACVRAAQYPPEGARSVGIARAQGYGPRLAESVENSNREVILVPQIEHIQAVRHIEDILEAAGVGAVFVGPYDLSGSLGIPGRVQDADVREAIRKVRVAAAKFGVPAGIFAGSADAARAAAAEGFDFICLATDTMLLGEGARRMLADAKSQ